MRQAFAKFARQSTFVTPRVMVVAGATAASTTYLWSQNKTTDLSHIYRTSMLAEAEPMRYKVPNEKEVESCRTDDG